jgi:hypothetical protein
MFHASAGCTHGKISLIISTHLTTTARVPNRNQAVSIGSSGTICISWLRCASNHDLERETPAQTSCRIACVTDPQSRRLNISTTLDIICCRLISRTMSVNSLVACLRFVPPLRQSHCVLSFDPDSASNHSVDPSQTEPLTHQRSIDTRANALAISDPALFHLWICHNPSQFLSINQC